MNSNIDTLELQGLGFRCIDGCAYCCLCPPELAGKDKEYFLSSRKEVVDDLDGTPHIALQGGAGGCKLLRDRRCTDYQHRPFHCRSFPVRVHMSFRVQACANLSCRGITSSGGEPLEKVLDIILEQEMARRIGPDAQEAFREWDRFVGKSRHRGIEVDLTGAREVLEENIAQWPGAIGTDSEEITQLAFETFNIRELPDCPVYVAPDLQWRIYRADGKDLREYRLGEDGSLATGRNWPMAAIPVLQMTSDGEEEFRKYLRILNNRDSMAASAALVSKMTDFEEEFEETYFEMVRDCALDFWWRASLLAFVKGESVLGAAELREGVVFCDADFLDMPGVGGML